MYFYNMINILSLFLIILLLFIIINIYLLKKEHMSMRSSYFNNKLNEKGYRLNIETKSIVDNNNNIIKKYPTLNFNSMESHYIAKNKPLTNKILMENNIPTPKHIIITDKNKNMLYNIKQYFPCVLKPVDGMQGKDVYTHIDTLNEFNEILNKLLNKYDKIMLENLVYGNNYRVFVFNNKIMDIIEREKPFIIGNGRNNVQQLIDQKNSILSNKNLFIVKYIDKKLILSQGYKMNEIVKNNHKIFITNTVNFHNGANAKRIPIDKVSIKNLELFIKAHKLIGLECSGVDYMSENIEIAYNMNKGHIIEMNDMVDTKIHIDADGKQNPNLLFKNMVNTF